MQRATQQQEEREAQHDGVLAWHAAQEEAARLARCSRPAAAPAPLPSLGPAADSSSQGVGL